MIHRDDEANESNSMMSATTTRGPRRRQRPGVSRGSTTTTAVEFKRGPRPRPGRTSGGTRIGDDEDQFDFSDTSNNADGGPRRRQSPGVSRGWTDNGRGIQQRSTAEARGKEGSRSMCEGLRDRRQMLGAREGTYVAGDQFGSCSLSAWTSKLTFLLFASLSARQLAWIGATHPRTFSVPRGHQRGPQPPR